MNAQEAIGFRDCLLTCIARQPDVLDDCFGALGATHHIGRAKAVDVVVAAIRLSSVVLWEMDLFNAAVSGARSFQEQSASRLDFNAPELWIANFDIPVLDSQSARESLDIPEHLFFHAFLIVPIGATGVLQVLIYSTTEQSALPPNPDAKDLLAFRAMRFQLFGSDLLNEYLPIVACRRFMELEFVSRQRQVLPRHIRRAADQKRRPPLPEINVVTLRRTARDTHASEGGEARDYSCQWMVSGHWRKPSPQMKEPRPVYVRPYVKGPEDKPLRQPRGTIYAVNR